MMKDIAFGAFGCALCAGCVAGLDMGGAVAADLHSRACLNAKLRRLADACAMLAKIG